MRIIEIKEDKLEQVSHYAEQMLRFGGKVMQCLDDLQRGGHMGERGGYMGERYPMEEGWRGEGRMGRRGDDDERMEREEMGYRRGRNGRYY